MEKSGHLTLTNVKQPAVGRADGLPAAARTERKEEHTALAAYERACTALAEALTVLDVQRVRASVEHLKTHARLAKDRNLSADAMVLQQRSERRLGEMLIAAKEAGQIGVGRPKHAAAQNGANGEPFFDSLTLKQAGIDKKLSARAQKLAEIPSADFEAVVERSSEKIRAGGAVVVNPVKDHTTREKAVLRAVKEAQLAARQKALPEKKYGVILADPEWPFEVWSAAGMDRSADNHYPTSALEVIEARPVPTIAADDCVLFLWVTSPHHAAGDGAMVMRAWGFEPKAQIVWGKDTAGTGFWFRDMHEVLLVGVRGKVPAPAMGTQWPSLINSPKGLHSEKPDWAYELIEDYFPNLPKIELNARRRRDGWDAWGFEAPDAVVPSDALPAADGTEQEKDAVGPDGPQGAAGTEQEKDEEIPAGSHDGGPGQPVQASASAQHPTVEGLEDVTREPGPSNPDAVASASDLNSDRPDAVVGEDGGADLLVQPLDAALSDRSEDGSIGQPLPVAADVVGAPPAEATIPSVASADLPDPATLSSERKNQLIRDGYAVNTPLDVLAAQTGLSRDAVKQRARTMKLSSRDRQREMASAFTTQQNAARRAADRQSEAGNGQG